MGQRSMWTWSLVAACAIWTSAVARGEESLVPDVAARLAQGEPVRVVCFGDSVTGIYYHTGGRRAYPEMLQVALRKLYPQGNIEVINAGISGNTTRDALARIDRDVLRHRPQLVTVMFGLNDSGRLPLEDYRENLAKIIRLCRAQEAEVILLTPNGIQGQNPKLDACLQTLHELGKAHNVAVIDVFATYRQVQQRDPVAFALLLSDPIHPNMDGHKLNAETIARGIAGRAVSLQDEGPLSPAIPRTLQRVADKQPLKILAMPPYDAHAAAAFAALAPDVPVEITPWDVAGKKLTQIEADAKTVRGQKYDLVIVAVPLQETIEPIPAFARSYGWVLNWSLSFGRQEWDVIAIPPSVTAVPQNEAERTQDALVRQLIRAQDLSLVQRPADDDSSAADLFRAWLKRELAAEQ